MQCPHCRKTIDAKTPTELSACPECGRSFSSRATKRSGISAVLIILTLLFVISAALAGSAIFVAMRVIKERDQAQQNYQQASKMIDQTVAAICNSADLKGKLEPARNEMLQPAMEYYKQYVAAHEKDKDLMPEVAAAQLRIAGLHARMGSTDSVAALAKANLFLVQLRDSTADPERFPSMQETALQMAPSNDWINVKGGSMSDMQKHGINLLLTLQAVISNMKTLADKHPQTLKFRDDVADMSKSAAMVLTFAGRPKEAFANWRRAAEACDLLVQAQPANTDYQTRLAESLTNMAKLKKSLQDPQSSIADFERAQKIREQLVAAKPDDAAQAKELAAVTRDLEKAKADAAKAATKTNDSKGEEKKPAETSGEETAAAAPAAE